MKPLKIILMLIFWVGFCFGQQVTKKSIHEFYNSPNPFSSNLTAIAAKAFTGFTGVSNELSTAEQTYNVLLLDDTLAFSNRQKTNSSSGEKWITTSAENISKTLNANLWIYIETGKTSVDSTGYTRHHLFNFTTSDSVETINFKDSTWWSDFPIKSYYYMFEDSTGTQSNYFTLDDFDYIKP